MPKETNMTDFQGRKTVISGATRGIGKAIAMAFLEAGATVIGVYSSNRKAADSFMQEWEESACKKLKSSGFRLYIRKEKTGANS